MAKSKRQQEILQSTEEKLTKIFEEFNAEKSGAPDGRLVCETQCTMARIRSFSDFMYLIRVKPLQTMAYYGAAVFFLLTLAAVWCFEWLLTAVFAVIFLILASMPHFLRIRYFNRTADNMEDSYNKIINADFTAEDRIILTISGGGKKRDFKEESRAEGSSVLSDSAAETREIPYKAIAAAFECSHSFYLFPDTAGRNAKSDPIICDKTQFLCGTPMQLRDKLIRTCGKRFKIKVKKA